MDKPFKHVTEPVQVGLCPICAAPVMAITTVAVWEGNCGQLVDTRRDFKCSDCRESYSYVSMPYPRRNSNDVTDAKPEYEKLLSIWGFARLRIIERNKLGHEHG